MDCDVVASQLDHSGSGEQIADAGIETDAAYSQEQLELYAGQHRQLVLEILQARQRVHRSSAELEQINRVIAEEKRMHDEMMKVSNKRIQELEAEVQKLEQSVAAHNRE